MLGKIHVKFCGMTRREDIEKAIDLKADFIGMIFFPRSPRYIKPTEAKQICDHLDFSTTKKTGVFVNTSLTEILDTVSTLGLDVIQLHGDESAGQIKEIEKQSRAQVWKTVRVQNITSADMISQDPLEFFLIDTFSQHAFGGTGKCLDIDLVKMICQIQRDLPAKKIIVAGGLNPNNIGKIIPYSPWGIDINSGVESAPGIKDHFLMTQAIKTVRNYPCNGTDKISV